MATALTLEQYLTHHGAAYDVMSHEPTTSSLRTASRCHVPAECLAKGVVLKDGRRYLLAVLPASHRLEVQTLEKELNRQLSLASEDEAERLFTDCERGAIPPIGEAYGVETIVDESITTKPDVYFEGGDHETLVHMAGPGFARLMALVPHARFATHA